MDNNQNIYSRLFTAVIHGNLETARELINSFGLSHLQAWSEGYVLLSLALEINRAAVAKLLLESGCKVNSKNSRKNPCNTPLHFAAKNGDIEIVKMILDRGGIVNAENEYGRTPLHYAIENKKIEVTELLLKYQADVNASDIVSTCPLHAAVGIGCLQIVEHLLRRGADVNRVCTEKWRRGFAALHFAVENGNKEIVSLLLSRGANVDIKTEDNITPLHIAAKKGCIDISEDLLNHGACINSCTLRDGYTPLHFASERGDEEAVKLFLNRGADVNAITNDNLTPLHIATKRGSKKVVKLLLENGAKVDHQDKDGKTTLHLAVEKKYLTIVEDVLKYCPDINDQSNRSSLKIAVKGYGEEYQKIVEALLEYGFIVDPEDVDNPELLHAAVEKGYLKIVDDLLKNGADVHTLYNSSFKKGLTPLHSAAKHQQEEVAKLLISYGADINAQDKNGKTPIFHAIWNTDFKITNLLLTNGANIRDPDLLNIAVRKECIEIVEVLLQHGVDINASDKYGKTALYFTTFGEIKDNNIKDKIAKLLLSRGANVDAQTKDGKTILYYAIQYGYEKVVEVLLEYNANVNSKEKNDFTPLHMSAQTGNKEITTMLLNKGADVNAKQKDGMTALHLAAQNGHKEVLKLLLEFGAKVDSKTRSDRTPLHSSVLRGYPEIIKTILEFGANIDSRDKDGITPLHLASQYGNKKAVVTLLEHGSDVNITSINNHTPLDEAVAGIIVEALKRHVVKLKTANLYVSEKILRSMCINIEIKHFQDECEKELASMKREKIDNLNISFYDILAKSTSSLVGCMRNENIVRVFKSDDYKTTFPIYASMIKNNFRKSMERREVLEQGNKHFHLLFNSFPELPYDCTEKIFNYLSNEELRILMDACKPLSITNSNANINDVITSSISQEEPPFKIRKNN